MAMSRRSGQKAVRRFEAKEWAGCRGCPKALQRDGI